MPELPEVETIRLQLKKYLIGHKIKKVIINYPKCFVGDPNLLVDGEIKDIRRFGKVQAIDLSNGYSIVIHIKMTGQLIYRGPNLKKEISLSKKINGGLGGKHTHVVFELDNDGLLYYNDVRKFGWLHIVKSTEVEEHKFIGKLGPEPFVTGSSSGQTLSLEYFKKVLSRTTKPIKVVIMDQSKIGGVGNIYANDALWLSKIDPKTPAKSMSVEKTSELYKALISVLKEGLKYGGASELAFVTPDGAEGEYQNHTLVYGHQNQMCVRCNKSKIEKYFLGGRGTYWCPFCQK